MIDIREELARAICRNIDGNPDKEIRDGGDFVPRWRFFLTEADAVLPIIARVRAEERERCARVVDGGAFGPCAEDVQAGAAAAIRALGDE